MRFPTWVWIDNVTSPSEQYRSGTSPVCAPGTGAQTGLRQAGVTTLGSRRRDVATSSSALSPATRRSTTGAQVADHGPSLTSAAAARAQFAARDADGERQASATSAGPAPPRGRAIVSPCLHLLLRGFPYRDGQLHLGVGDLDHRAAVLDAVKRRHRSPARRTWRAGVGPEEDALHDDDIGLEVVEEPVSADGACETPWTGSLPGRDHAGSTSPEPEPSRVTQP